MQILNLIGLIVLLSWSSGCREDKSSKDDVPPQPEQPTENSEQLEVTDQPGQLLVTIRNKDNLTQDIEQDSLLFLFQLSSVPDLTIFEIQCKFAPEESFDSAVFLPCDETDRHQVNDIEAGVAYRFAVRSRNLINDELGPEDQVSFKIERAEERLLILGEDTLKNTVAGRVELAFVLLNEPQPLFQCFLNGNVILAGCADGAVTVDYSNLSGNQVLTVVALDRVTGQEIVRRDVAFFSVGPQEKPSRCNIGYGYQSCGDHGSY